MPLPTCPRSRRAVLPLAGLCALMTLSACAPGAMPRREAPTHETLTGVHGTVGVGVNSQRGPIANADITLSVCRKPRPVTIGVGVARREVDLRAEC